MAEQTSRAGTVSTVIGILILVLSGGCTLFFLALDFSNGMASGLWGFALILGVPPILLGLAILWFGRWRAKRARAEGEA